MSNQKLGRNYRLTIDVKDGGAPIVIQPPFTMRFWVARNTLSSVNNASVDVYNLSQGNRKRIFQDRYDTGGVVVNGANLGPRTIKLEVGYGNLLYTIYTGQMLIASSSRQGVDIVTRIEGLAGIYDLSSSTVNITLAAGSTLKQVFTTLIGQLPTTGYGFVSDFTQIFPRPVVLNGKPWELMKAYAEGGSSQGPINLFIDNNKAYCMLASDKLKAPGSVPILNAASGLLDTPRREQAYISVTTLLEAGVQINSIIEIDSVVESAFNGQYGVIGLQHSGVISGAVSGDCRSVFQLLQPKFFKYNLVQGA